MRPCIHCDGEGGWDDGGEDCACPHCHGSGWEEGIPPALSEDDLDERCGEGLPEPAP